MYYSSITYELQNEVLIWKNLCKKARKLFSHSVTAAPLDLIPLVLRKALFHRASLSAFSLISSILSKQKNLWYYRISWVKRPFSPACGKPHVAWQWRSKEKGQKDQESQKKKKRKSIPKSPKSVTTKGEFKILLQSNSILLSGNCWLQHPVALNNLSL